MGDWDILLADQQCGGMALVLQLTTMIMRPTVEGLEDNGIKIMVS